MPMHREAQFNQEVLIDPTPLPSSIPAVDEVGATSAPLKSASFTIGARCRDFMDDFMACKRDAGLKGDDADFTCLPEGRKVTRCATETLSFIGTDCGREFKLHWNCLENKNHEFANCRPAEQHLNKCIFDKMVCLSLFSSSHRPEDSAVALLSSWLPLPSTTRLAVRCGPLVATRAKLSAGPEFDLGYASDRSTSLEPMVKRDKSLRVPPGRPTLRLAT